MNRTLSRRIATALAGPAVAAGIFAGTLAVSSPAEASPSAGTKGSSMAMPGPATYVSPNPTPHATTFTIPC